MIMGYKATVAALLLTTHGYGTYGFVNMPTKVLFRQHPSSSFSNNALLPQPLRMASDDNGVSSDVGKEVQELLARAKAIRDSLPTEEPKPSTTKAPTPSKLEMETDSDSETSSIGYRLYIDIGREDGTWMDPTWGRSGKRIEGSIDISFQLPVENSEEDTTLAGQDIIDQMVKDNLSGKSTVVRNLQSSNARLRGGFDKMVCNGGGYRIDIGKDNNRSASSTTRFFIDVAGTEESGSSYGDIFIPEGSIYFSLPCFVNSVKQLSSKEGIITVRQFGWHTGWRREESRIIGVFRAVPLEKAKKRDRY